MIGRLLRRLTAPGSTAPAALPEVLELAPGGEARVVFPKVENGHAAVVNSFQGFFIFNHYDAGVGWRLRSFNACEAGQTHFLYRPAGALPPDPGDPRHRRQRRRLHAAVGARRRPGRSGAPTPAPQRFFAGPKMARAPLPEMPCSSNC